MILEKVDLIDGDLHRECSLEESGKDRKESLPLIFGNVFVCAIVFGLLK